MSDCTVVSLVPFPIREEKPGLIPSRYFIPASDSIKPRVLVIKPAMHYVYLDETRGNLQVRDASEEVARSIVQDYVNAQLGITEGAAPGLFWVSGAKTVEEVVAMHGEEIILHKGNQKRWFTIICRLADDDWNKYHQHNVISDFQRKAANLIGLNPEDHLWMNPEAAVKTATTKCHACLSEVPQGTIVCSVCRCVLDAAKYKTLQFA